MNEFSLKGSITDKDFMVHVLKNFPKRYDIILNGLEDHLMASGDNVLTIDIIREKLNHWYEKIKTKMKKKEKKKSLQEPIINNRNKDVISVVSMVTNLVIVNV